ncbi:hypothetical protein [Aureivirga sp. CE67]|uniref:hypothetical protein n=1 Tax=Aureivirga sp. CE67 TaxID=1788983 RepID=UPI0018CB0B63|nr:hypothetical protein [Aureivirga sp. CE67]
MKKNKILLICFTILISSCNQEKINNLQEKISELENNLTKKDSIINSQNIELNSLVNELQKKDEILKKRNQIKKYSDIEIIEIVKRDREYYCPNAKRKNFVVRKINSNIYDVRFNFMTTESFTFKEWIPTVYRIQFLPNNKYTIKLQKGTLC